MCVCVCVCMFVYLYVHLSVCLAMSPQCLSIHLLLTLPSAHMLTNTSLLSVYSSVHTIHLNLSTQVRLPSHLKSHTQLHTYLCNSLLIHNNPQIFLSNQKLTLHNTNCIQNTQTKAQLPPPITVLTRFITGRYISVFNGQISLFYRQMTHTSTQTSS